MKLTKLKKIIAADHFRFYKNVSNKEILKHIFYSESFKYIFWMRVCSFTKKGKHRLLFLFTRLILNHYKYKLGICIPYNTQISEGFYIGHFGGIIVSPKAIIGQNCNLSHGVTIGKISRGKNSGAPIIGNNVYIGPGAKIIGGITIGDNVAIGANSVVVSDVPKNCTFGGIPAKQISTSTSSLYINNTDYLNEL